MFFPRMWSDEVERIGMQRCTPKGFTLKGVGELISLSGLLLLLGVPIVLGYHGIVGQFTMSLLWWLAVPFGLGIIGSVMVALSWSMAQRKHFHYDYEQRVSSWIEGGELKTYTYADFQAEQTRCG